MLKTTLILIASALILTGCGYFPHQVHEFTTTSGDTIKLSCPTAPANFPTSGIILNGRCMVVE